MATAGLTGNLAATYLGSYDLHWKLKSNKDGIAVVIFTVINSSIMQFASRPLVLGYLPIWQNTIGARINQAFKTGWGSRTTQNII